VEFTPSKWPKTQKKSMVLLCNKDAVGAGRIFVLKAPTPFNSGRFFRHRFRKNMDGTARP